MDTIKRDAERFKALGYPIRLCLLSLIARHGGSKNVGDLQRDLEIYGYVIEQATLSAHLRTLYWAGFIEEQRAGQEHYYCVRGDALAASQDALADLARLAEVAS